MRGPRPVSLQHRVARGLTTCCVLLCAAPLQSGCSDSGSSSQPAARQEQNVFQPETRALDKAKQAETLVNNAAKKEKAEIDKETQ